jgi:hypothetical protein
MDIAYQKNVINYALNQISIKPIDEFYLCLVKYEKANKNELTFCLSEFASDNKGGCSDTKDLEQYTKYSDE